MFDPMIRNSLKPYWVATVALMAGLMAPGTAEAHIIPIHGGGFVNGFAHPFSGIDHLLVMLSVGLLAYRWDGKNIWLLPLGFVAVAGIGLMIGMHFPGMPGMEAGIAASLVAVGILTTLEIRPRAYAGTLGVIAFAFFHGHVHGSAMPAEAAASLYAMGFLSATLCLHAIGISIGWLVNSRPVLLRLAGAGTALTGLWFIALTAI